MAKLITTEAEFDAALAALIAADPRLAEVLARAGRPALRRRPVGFEGLAAIVVSQQLSTASAGAIWKRLSEALDPVDHEKILRARKATLQRAGLSEGKIRTLKAMAKAIRDGGLDLAAIAEHSAEEAHRVLTAVTGIGPWTADIYLLFCLGQADAWPAGDLALQEAVRHAFGLAQRPNAKEMIALAEPWRPWRGVAAFLLWAYYAAIRRREAAPVQPRPRGG